MAMHAVQTRPMLQQRAYSVKCLASAVPKPSLARKVQQFGAAALVTTGASCISSCGKLQQLVKGQRSRVSVQALW